VTGASSDDGEAERVVTSLRAVSDVPLYVGIGISTPAQAARAASFSDGAIVGAALVKVILDGASVSEVESFVRSFRAALD
jgi:tryptophan synthase alpha chain